MYIFQMLIFKNFWVVPDNNMWHAGHNDSQRVYVMWFYFTGILAVDRGNAE